MLDFGFITENELLTLLQRQNYTQIIRLNPDSAKTAYKTAVGFVRSKLASLYYIDSHLSADWTEDNMDERDETLLFIMISLTAWFMASGAMQISQTISNNYGMACSNITDLQNGYSTFYKIDRVEDDSENSAYPNIVSSDDKYLG